MRFMNLDDQIPLQIWKVSAIISLNKLSLPFSLSSSGTPITHQLFISMVSHNFDRLSLLISILPFVPLAAFKWPVFQFTNYFFCLAKTIVEALH